MHFVRWHWQSCGHKRRTPLRCLSYSMLLVCKTPCFGFRCDFLGWAIRTSSKPWTSFSLISRLQWFSVTIRGSHLILQWKDRPFQRGLPDGSFTSWCRPSATSISKGCCTEISRRRTFWCLQIIKTCTWPTSILRKLFTMEALWPWLGLWSIQHQRSLMEILPRTDRMCGAAVCACTWCWVLVCRKGSTVSAALKLLLLRNDLTQWSGSTCATALQRARQWSPTACVWTRCPVPVPLRFLPWNGHQNHQTSQNQSWWKRKPAESWYFAQNWLAKWVGWLSRGKITL